METAPFFYGIAGLISLIAGILSLICLIVFFVMALALSNISKNVRTMTRVLVAWQGQTGYGVTYTCSKCKKNYVGKVKNCPHCGDEKGYS